MARLFKRLTRGGKPSEHWWATWKNHQGRKRTRSTGVSDEEKAQIIANGWEGDDALARHGHTKHVDRRSVEATLTEYESAKRAAGRSKDYIDGELDLIRRICKATGIKTIADLSVAADRVTKFAVQ